MQTNHKLELEQIYIKDKFNHKSNYGEHLKKKERNKQTLFNRLDIDWSKC